MSTTPALNGNNVVFLRANCARVSYKVACQLAGGKTKLREALNRAASFDYATSGAQIDRSHGSEVLMLMPHGTKLYFKPMPKAQRDELGVPKVNMWFVHGYTTDGRDVKETLANFIENNN